MRKILSIELIISIILGSISYWSSIQGMESVRFDFISTCGCLSLFFLCIAFLIFFIFKKNTVLTLFMGTIHFILINTGFIITFFLNPADYIKISVVGAIGTTLGIWWCKITYLEFTSIVKIEPNAKRNIFIFIFFYVIVCITAYYYIISFGYYETTVRGGVELYLIFSIVLSILVFLETLAYLRFPKYFFIGKIPIKKNIIK